MFSHLSTVYLILSLIDALLSIYERIEHLLL